jgi:drug/metabolite transporter (DMT)-like permease
MKTESKRSSLPVLLLLGLIWGSSFLFIKLAVEHIPPFTLALVRVSLAALSLYAVLRIRGMRMPPFGPIWGVYLLMGLLNGAIPYTLISAGEITIDSGLAAILNATMPIFTILLAHFLTEDEGLTWLRLLGVLVGLVGVIVLVGPEALYGFSSHFWSQMAVVGASVSYALAAVIGRRYLRNHPAIVSSAGQFIGGTVLLAPFSLLLDNPWKLHPSWSSIGSLLTLSFLGTSFAYLLYYHLIRNAGATYTSLVTYLLPVTGVVWGVTLLGERLEWRALLAMALILIGIACTSGGWPKRSRLCRASIRKD